MNKDNAKDFLPLVQALAEGKTLQNRVRCGWHVVTEVAFGGDPKNYRIKPEPRVIWAVIRGDGVCVDANDSEYKAGAYASAYPGGRVVKFVEEYKP